MRVLFCKSRWEYGAVPLEAFFDRVIADGFDGVDLYLVPEKEDPDTVRAAVAQRRLHFIGQIATVGATPDEHLAALEAQVERAAASGADSFSGQVGSDFFPFEENLRLFRRALALAERHGRPFRFETHRGRALYTLPETLRYIEALPGIEITADFSHFMCVHETELRERRALLDKVIARTRHIHARVGFPEGPQVGHPLAPENRGLLDWYGELWEAMIAAGATTATPEAGPAPYMPALPFTGAPVADAWTVNAAVRDWLKQRLTK